MFLKKTSRQDEFYTDLSLNLEASKKAPELKKAAKTEQAIAKLLEAALLLDEVGLEKAASRVTSVLEVFAEDAAAAGLTSEKMEQNLKEKGTVFNADDGDILDSGELSPSEDLVVHEDGHMEEVPADYEICADCGFDHEYEPSEAHRAHELAHEETLELSPEAYEEPFAEDGESFDGGEDDLFASESEKELMDQLIRG